MSVGTQILLAFGIGVLTGYAVALIPLLMRRLFL